jgi:predicted transcriptional regulator
MFEENELVQEQIEQEVEQPSAEQIAAQQKQEKQENNFRELRKKNEQLERENKAALQYIEEQKLREKYAQQPQVQEHELSDDDIPDVGYVKRKLAKVQAELVEERKRQDDIRRQYEISTAESKLASQFPEYKELLADKNIELLRTIKPQLMNSIDNIPDIYDRAVAAMDAVKAFGIVGHDQYAAEKAAFKATATKPKPINALNPSQSNSALNNAHNFTNVMSDDERKRVYEEAVRRSRGG